LGVKGVINNIKIKSESHDEIEKKNIEEAIGRSGSIEGRDIIVSVSGSTVTLIGTVSSLHQKEEVARITWNTPGILRLKNELTVVYDYVKAK
jgi:osmotically-inducible protein OsmY